MSASALGTALRNIHRLLDEGTAASLGDPRLLARFAEAGDESAFAALVDRHGPMVLATCRSGLTDRGEVDDAFQATFLVLARRAGSVRNPEALGAWLHRVARRIVARSNRASAARRRHEARAGTIRGSGASDRVEDVSAALHEEIDRLPDRYRLPLVLCHLEGLTHAEAARRLRRGERTLRRHLAEAIPRLRTRLVGRGIALSAATLAAMLGRPAAAALPEALARRAARMAAPGVGPASAAAMAGRALLGAGAFKIKVASLIAGTLVATACLARSVLAVPGSDEPPMKKAPDPVPAAVAPPSKPAEGSWTFAGRVLDPDGRPFPGARLYLDSTFDPKETTPALRATSGPDGRFRFSMAKAGSRIDPDGSLFDLVHVAAVADGFGLGTSDGPESDADRELTVRLARDDVPVIGRLIDLEGRPIVGASVRVATYWVPDSGDLSAWIKAAKAGEEFSGRYNSPENHLARTDLDLGSNLIPPASTGADGRFRLVGIGRERIVEFEVSGPGVRKTKLTALTRTGPAFRAPEDPGPDGKYQETQFGATFEVIIPPSRPIEGVVRDVDTGRPIAGATITDIEVADEKMLGTRHSQATTGEDGRYRLTGLPKGSGNVVMILPPQDQPYLPSWKAIVDAPGLGPMTVDLALKRGVWAKGRVLDKASGKPLRFASVNYFAATDNPRLGEAPGFRDMKEFGIQGVHGQTLDDGIYRAAVLPGRGLLSVSVNDGRHPLLEPDPGLTDFAPLYNGFDHARRPIKAPETGEMAGIDFTIDGGRTVAGQVLDPDGKPLTGVNIYGTDWLGSWDSPSKSAEFSVDGLRPPAEGKPEAEKTLALVFRHDEKHLAGYRDVRWDEPGPIRVRLAPWGTLLGRVVGGSGEPRARVAVRAYVGGGRERRGGGLIDQKPGPVVVTDAEGRFRLEGLAPGLPYQLQLDYEVGVRWIDLPASPAGETTELGDLKIGAEAR